MRLHTMHRGLLLLAGVLASVAISATAASEGEGGQPTLMDLVDGPAYGDQGDAIVRLIAEHHDDIFLGGDGEDGAAILSPDEVAARINRGKARRRQQIVLNNKNKAFKSSTNKKAKAKKTGGFASITSTSGDTVEEPLDVPSGPKQGACAWQAYVTGRRMNVAFPDLQAVYQVLVMQNVDATRIFRIKGKFPSKGVRYFSLQSNNAALGIPVTTLKDYQMVPDKDSGVNPFLTDGGNPGDYTLHVTPKGDQGFANELALCPEDASCPLKINAVMIMRFYTSDPDLPPANSKVDPVGANNPRLWGYVPAATVETRTMTWKGTEKWTEFKNCDQSRPNGLTGLINENLKRSVPAFQDPVNHNLNNNFVLYLGDGSSGQRGGLYHNLDAAYLMAMAWQEPVPDYATRLVAKVTGVLPTTPRNFQNAPRIPNYNDYQMRYASFSTIGMEAGGPTIDTVDDATMERFYGNTAAWKDGDRSFSIVAGPSTGKTCGLYNGKTDLFLSTTYRGAQADYWGLMNRQLVPKLSRDQKPDQSLGYARLICAEKNTEDCGDPVVLERIMGQYYPKVQWYLCEEDGDLVPISKSLADKLHGTQGGN